MDETAIEVEAIYPFETGGVNQAGISAKGFVLNLGCFLAWANGGMQASQSLHIAPLQTMCQDG